VPQNPLQFDAANVFEPDGLIVRDALRGWRLPVWTSEQSAGQPLLAAQQSAPLFPLTWGGRVCSRTGARSLGSLLSWCSLHGHVLLARGLGWGARTGLIAG